MEDVGIMEDIASDCMDAEGIVSAPEDIEAAGIIVDAMLLPMLIDMVDASVFALGPGYMTVPPMRRVPMLLRAISKLFKTACMPIIWLSAQKLQNSLAVVTLLPSVEALVFEYIWKVVE